jgi:predicted kinase
MIIEPDQSHYVDGRYDWSPARHEAAWAGAFEEFDAALATRRFRRVLLLVGLPGAGKSTYAADQDAPDLLLFDGTFVNPARRATAIAIARAGSIPLGAVWLDTPWPTCLARNEQRPPDRRVPLAAMVSMHRNLLANPPTVAEGLCAVLRLGHPRSNAA